MSVFDRIRAAAETLTGAHHQQVGARLRKLEVKLDNANKRLVRLERSISDSRVGLAASQRRVERDLGAVLRLMAVDSERLPFPQRLTIRRFRLMSQNEEDGLILELIGACTGQQRRFVEFGCGSNGGNSGVLARELGWKGLMVDADERKAGAVRQQFASTKVKCVSSWITRDNADALITDAGLAGEIGLLSIDIDGNDYWVWEAVAACTPALVVVEYNSLFGPGISVAVPYAERFDRHAYPKSADGKAVYFGASLEALVRLGRRKGYRLVAVEPRGVNALFLRDGFRPEIHTSSARDCFRVLDKYIGHDLMKLVERHDLPLSEIPS